MTPVNGFFVFCHVLQIGIICLSFAFDSRKLMQGLDLYHFFYSPSNILSILVFLSVILIWTYFKSITIPDSKEASLYRWNVYHKLLFSSIFAIYYIAVFKGGDTYEYWRTMGALKNLMFHDFSNFWEVITSEPTMERFSGFFNYQTGYPPRFIYMEEESFFVAKVVLIFRLITFDSYLATTFLLSFIMANASWKIYTIARETGIFQKRLLAIFVLFLPSVAFWSSGISKDMIVFTSILNTIFYLYKLLKAKTSPEQKIMYGLFLLFFAMIIYHTRPFILYAMIIPLVLMYSTNLINKIKSFTVLRLFIKSFTYVILSGGFVYVLASVSADELLNSSESLSEAVTIQQDFAQNTSTYGGEGDDGKRYSLEIDYTLVGIIKAIPITVLTGIYRPFIWEASRPSLIFNGIESLLFMFMTIWFFLVKFNIRRKIIQSNELLVFSIGFVLVIAFMAGFTSILFGVLVRIRAPLLPFMGLLLSIDYKVYLNSLKNSPLLLNNES